MCACVHVEGKQSCISMDGWMEKPLRKNMRVVTHRLSQMVVVVRLLYTDRQTRRWMMMMKADRKETIKQSRQRRENKTDDIIFGFVCFFLKKGVKCCKRVES